MVIVGVYGGGCRCCIGNSDHAMLFSGSAVAVKSQALCWCNLWYCVALPLPISHYFTTMESGVPNFVEADETDPLFGSKNPNIPVDLSTCRHSA
jgi:hypothetical protein